MNEKQKNNPVPQLIIPSLHVNLLAGKLPKFIKIPTNILPSPHQAEFTNQKIGGCSV